MTFSGENRTQEAARRVETKESLHIDVAGSSGCDRVPGLGWTLPEESRDAIREIEANIRAAEQMSGSIVVG